MKSLPLLRSMAAAALLLGSGAGAAAADHDRYDDDDYGYYDSRDTRLRWEDVDVFYGPLHRHGLWVSLEPYGACWVPDVPIGWRPYTYGFWARSDWGWIWVSDEPWGWATYHYGRWAWTPGYGWVWVPGRVWAPAWVAWRYGDGIVGWAPLPPEARWQIDIGFTIGNVEFDAILGPSSWCFVRERDFCRPHIRRYLFRDRDCDHCYRTTLNTTRYVIREGRIINDGIDVRRIEAKAGRPVRHYRVIDRPDEARPDRDVVKGTDIHVFRPARFERRTEGLEVRDRDERPRNRIPESVRRGVEENRRTIERQHEERAQAEARYRERMQNLPPREREDAERKMQKDLRRIERRHQSERHDAVQRNVRERGKSEREKSEERGKLADTEDDRNRDSEKKSRGEGRGR